jgi:hypothetical protein
MKARRLFSVKGTQPLEGTGAGGLESYVRANQFDNIYAVF